MDKISWPGWENVELIGNGSFGAVYEIRREHYGMEERAALKVISIPQSKGDIDELINDGYDVSSITARYESYLKDIVGEYSMMAQMKGHSNIVYCDDLNCVKHDDGIGWDIYIKMELLTALPKALPQDIPVELVIKLGKDICKALIACKEYNIVHRDIKPQNIFVAKDGTYKLGDFGIAKTAERTTSGTKIGTYKYMAPEVYKSEPYGSAADIYSLGLVMYWLLNERRTPFLPLPPQVPAAGMEDEARTRRFKGEALPVPAHGSPELQAIVLKACAYDPKDRFASATEMLTALEELTSQAVVSVDTAAAAASVAPKAFTSNVIQPDENRTEATVSAFGIYNPQGELTESTVSAWSKASSQSHTTTPASPATPLETIKKKMQKPHWVVIVAAVLVVAIISIACPKTASVSETEALLEATTQPQQQQSKPVTQAQQKEIVRNIPDGTKLIEESWDDGAVTVVAIDDKTLWVQITDDRPTQQYGTLGTPWQLYLNLGEVFQWGTEEWQSLSTYHVQLYSPAHSALLKAEYDQGNTSPDYTEEHLKPLCWMKSVALNGGHTFADIAYTDLDIEKKGNTYTAVISPPEWFDVSFIKDVNDVSVSLYDTDFWPTLCQYGSAGGYPHYTFEP